MTIPVTERLRILTAVEHDLGEYQTGVPRWCDGCGDNAILAAVQKVCRDEGLAPERTVFVSGIGCSSRLPHYMRAYGFHGTHGRALPIAEGVKMSRPDLAVFVSTGDGDCLSIGAAHWIHALRYNMDLTVLLHDNRIYGLTKKQVSPTSPLGTKSNTTPSGSVLRGLDPLAVTLAVPGVSFVAQAVDWIPEVLHQIVLAAYRHKGMSFVRILQRCPEFMPGAFEPYVQDPRRTLLLRHERPEHPRARPVRPGRGTGDRRGRGSDPGRDPLPRPRRAAVRGPAGGRRGPDARRGAARPRGRVRQVHHPAARRHDRERRGLATWTSGSFST